jgi:FkbM family methyltransferase
LTSIRLDFRQVTKMGLLAELKDYCWPLSKERSYALYDMDLKLDVLFQHKRDGFFVEAGANDGRTQSNTLYFERYRGWTGLLIEPIPKLAQLCRRRRPKDIVENAALVPFDYPDKQIQMQYCDLMSVVKGAMKSEQEEQEHLTRGAKIQGVQTYKTSVPARTLTSILDQHNIERIDLLSLDVEGFELSALKGLDLKRHRPNFMLIEARFRAEIDAHLSPWYDVVSELSHHDVLYRAR